MLVYDGLSTDRNDAIKRATNIRSNGGRIITIGVGDSVSYSELLSISGNNKYVLSLQGSDSVDRLYSLIMSEALQPECLRKYDHLNNPYSCI